MVRVESSNRMEYERVATDEWLNGVIEKIETRTNTDKKYKDKESGEYLTKTVEECRFMFSFEGYKFPHRSRWMTLSVSEKSNLYKNYLKKLCPELKPDTSIELDNLIGKKVKVMWEDTEWEGTVYQNITTLKPITPITLEELV